jgi:hypothetical protein
LLLGAFSLAMITSVSAHQDELPYSAITPADPRRPRVRSLQEAPA